MSVKYDKYETVIGLEVHAQLLTASKLFCGDATAFGAEPNTQVSPITLGHPGTLPKLNKKAIEYAIRMGLVCHCDIEKNNYFARKNYFYPDLPKGYQISQHTTPICSNGHVTIKVNGEERQIRLTRIHLEEDAGKSIHDVDPQNTSLDYNRAGVPLIEIVSEPDMRTSDEAYAYVTEIRKLVRWIGICDGNMEEGSLRCDANISIRLKGEKKLGTKVEVKNMNSIRNVKKAIDSEVKRLIELTENGETIRQETRSYDADTETSFAIRTKEDAEDYRYFPEPDLTPFNFTDDFIGSIKNSLPALPEALIKKYTVDLGLPEYDARVICEDKSTAEYFEKLISETKNFKAAANFLLGPIKSFLNEKNTDMSEFNLAPSKIAGLIALIDEGKINFSTASQKILPELTKNPGKSAQEIVQTLGLIQDSDASNIQVWVDQVLSRMPDKVEEYRKGKKGLIGLFVGEVKKISKGKADPKITNDLLLEKLNQ
ncbi:MAG: Asp-tRNA(Asn)/Glu-tRNA(Gln) amidotransferase GatCAB subunit B [Bacteroidetes bacterium]|nr:MAG: Asp-tRNA(Asn)/Glu-tRNA(Gln) amidotransferase GatCAB subunit B [Bacteroidota bacterium]